MTIPNDPKERERRMKVADRFTEDKPLQGTPKKPPFNNGEPIRSPRDRDN